MAPPTSAESILRHLKVVEDERRLRLRDPKLLERVDAIKRFQQRRFSHTYADLLSSPRYEKAASFFLEELYGPADFSQRDSEFARVIPALVRLFPQSVVDTVQTLAALHALSERLDTAMGERSSLPVTNALDYLRIWQAVGRAAEREEQIDLTLTVGRSLDEFTRKPLLRHSLRMMRGPAHAAGLAELQRFLEAGFDAFAAMNGASSFLALIGDRERRLAASLFRASSDSSSDDAEDALGQLP